MDRRLDDRIADPPGAAPRICPYDTKHSMNFIGCAVRSGATDAVWICHTDGRTAHGRSAVALLGLPRRAETAAATATVRIDDHGAVRGIYGAPAEQGSDQGQATENFHVKNAESKVRPVYFGALKQGSSGGYQSYAPPWDVFGERAGMTAMACPAACHGGPKTSVSGKG